MPQQGPPPPEVQSSPVGRHVATASSTHLFPCDASHLLEQHWPFDVQSVPSRRHSAPPQMPALQPNEQQSLACWHAAPEGRQGARHVRVAVPFTGSHSPLQQSDLDAHGVPAPAHVPGTEQMPEAQCVEQQSDPLPQDKPNARQADAGEAASHTGPPVSLG